MPVTLPSTIAPTAKSIYSAVLPPFILSNSATLPIRTGNADAVPAACHTPPRSRRCLCSLTCWLFVNTGIRSPAEYPRNRLSRGGSYSNSISNSSSSAAAALSSTEISSSVRATPVPHQSCASVAGMTLCGISRLRSSCAIWSAPALQCAEVIESGSSLYSRFCFFLSVWALDLHRALKCDLDPLHLIRIDRLAVDRDAPA